MHEFKNEEELLKAMIDYAKDRLADDLLDFLKTNRIHYSDWDDDTRKQLHTMCMLLSMPDDREETLSALSVSYWNGIEDTFWESVNTPTFDAFIGFCMENGKWKGSNPRSKRHAK